MPNKNFLVTGANGDIGEAMGRILRESFPDAQLHGADATGMGPGYRVFDEIHTVPWAGDAGYAEGLLGIVSSLGETLVIPSSEPELRCLAHGVDGLNLLMNRPDIVLRFLDKLKTARWLAEQGLPCPETMPLAEAGVDLLPMIVKPRLGSGSRDIEVVRSQERLHVVQAERKDDAVAQALLEPDDEEFTVAIFRRSPVVRVLVMRRRLFGNMTAYMRVEENPEIESIMVRLAEALSLEGVLNVQLRVTSNGPQIFEINPRFSSTVMMRNKVGFRDLIWLIEARSGEQPSPYSPPRHGCEVYRMSREVVMP